MEKSKVREKLHDDIFNRKIKGIEVGEGKNGSVGEGE